MMSIKHGQYIDAKTIEHETSNWAGEKFENLCNAYVWSFAPNAVLSSRPNVKDGGIDAEVFLDDDWDESKNPILKHGWNVFQFKKRASNRLFTQLKQSIEGEFNRINKNKVLSKYILISNLALTHNQINKLKESIAHGLDPMPEERIQIIDAGQLEGFLNNYPHIRSAFFATQDFQTWKEKYDNETKVYGFFPELIGRENELATLKQFIESPDIKCCCVSGPHAIGKTRFVLEATKVRQNQVIVSLNNNIIDYQELKYLTNQKQDTICIIEDPPLDKIRDFSRLAVQIPRLKIIITVPTKGQHFLHTYNFDERTEIIELKPFNWEQTSRLIHACKRYIPHNIEDWIVQNAGGNPGIILLAVSLSQSHKFIDVQPDFIKQIGNGFEEDIRNRFGTDAVEALKRLSLFSQTGISNNYRDEIDSICQVFTGCDNNTVLNLIDDTLVNSGIVQKKGDFAEVTIPLLANHLTVKLIRGNFDKTITLIARLSESANYRLFARLCDLDKEETNRLWDELFDSFFNQESNIFKYSKILEALSGTVPEKVLHSIESFLLDSDVQYRQNIKDNDRRNLIHVLEQLLFRKKTSYEALRLIGLLAEAENENYANNSTRLFGKCFFYNQPQLPLSYDKRLQLINELNSKKNRIITSVLIESISNSFSFPQFWSPVSYKGFMPFDENFQPQVWREVFDYAEKLMGLLWEIGMSNDTNSEEALNHLLKFLSDVSTIAPKLAEIAVQNFEKLNDENLKKRYSINHHNLDEYMRLTRDNFIKISETDESGHYQVLIERMNVHINDIDESSLDNKVKRFIGGWSRHLNREEDERELIQLADEIIENGKISSDLFEWLLSDQARRNYQMFWALGHRDKNLNFWDDLIEKLNNKKYSNLFSSYFNGIASTRFDSANKIWDEWIDKEGITEDIWLRTLTRLDPTDKRITKLIYKIDNNIIESQFASSNLQFSYFYKKLNVKQIYSILVSIAGKQYTDALSMLKLLHCWIYENKEITNEIISLGWKCLENVKTNNDLMEQYEIDEIAAYLTKKEPEKGFQLFENAVKKYILHEFRIDDSETQEERWKPYDAHSYHAYPDTLKNLDTKRFYLIFINIEKQNKFAYIDFEFFMKKYINLEQDYDILVNLSKDSIKNARIISNWITSRNQKFYDYVNEILPLYPNDEMINTKLSMGIEQLSLSHSGPEHAFYDSLIPEIDKRIENKNTHIVVREWLIDYKNSLEDQIKKHIVWEYNEDIDSIRSYINDKNSELRLWAISRILKNGKMKDIQELLSIEDIQEVLPDIQIPEERREMIEKSLMVWKNEI